MSSISRRISALEIYRLVHVSIIQSKTDPSRKGVNIFVGSTSTDLWPVAALLDYLKVRGSSQGPLLVFTDGCLLTRTRFVDCVRDALSKAEVDERHCM